LNGQTKEAEACVLRYTFKSKRIHFRYTYEQMTAATFRVEEEEANFMSLQNVKTQQMVLFLRATEAFIVMTG
jgi:hypothetical protein